ncbi:hypothetical protein FJZ19_06095, partial [Candidatus Pacearchaeota archaeon]|nr:hypothetical protein [Candidatus Pacearchaeota archaeon]
MNKITLFVSVLLVLSIVSVSAALEIEKKPVNDVVILEFSDPAIFTLTLRNTGSTESFEIYSLVGVEILPKEPFTIPSGETKTIDIMVNPLDKTKKRSFTFVYKIKGKNSGIQEDTLSVDLVGLKDALEIGVYDIHPESEQATLYIKNKVNFNFPEIKASFNSAFFNTEKTFSLSPLEKKEFVVPIDKEKIKTLVAGKYILSGNVEIKGVEENIEGDINFIEKSGIKTTESISGIIFREKIIEKENIGNLPSIAEAKTTKDIISRLFTSFNVYPDKSERKNIFVYYSWVKELRPGDKLQITIKTNYLYPLIILIVIVLGAYLIYRYNISNLSLKKRVTFVKTKGGEFALKVTISASARKFVEKISIIDRIPAMTKIYERFGAYPPDNIDEKNRRLEWNIEGLQPGEERVFSYIIYSKIGVVGKFELPIAT